MSLTEEEIEAAKVELLALAENYLLPLSVAFHDLGNRHPIQAKARIVVNFIASLVMDEAGCGAPDDDSANAMLLLADIRQAILTRQRHYIGTVGVTRQ